MEGIKVKVDTRWFGTIDIDDEKIITFDLGVIGFEDCKSLHLYTMWIRAMRHQ